MRTTDTIARIISMGEYIRQECVMMELCLLLLLLFLRLSMSTQPIEFLVVCIMKFFNLYMCSLKECRHDIYMQPGMFPSNLFHQALRLFINVDFYTSSCFSVLQLFLLYISATLFRFPTISPLLYVEIVLIYFDCAALAKSD